MVTGLDIPSPSATAPVPPSVSHTAPPPPTTALLPTTGSSQTDAVTLDGSDEESEDDGGGPLFRVTLKAHERVPSNTPFDIHPKQMVSSSYSDNP